jgi:hypothetical protein
MITITLSVMKQALQSSFFPCRDGSVHTQMVNTRGASGRRLLWADRDYRSLVSDAQVAAGRLHGASRVGVRVEGSKWTGIRITIMVYFKDCGLSKKAANFVRNNKHVIQDGLITVKNPLQVLPSTFENVVESRAVPVRSYSYCAAKPMSTGNTPKPTPNPAPQPTPNPAPQPTPQPAPQPACRQLCGWGFKNGKKVWSCVCDTKVLG